VVFERRTRLFVRLLEADKKLFLKVC